MIEILKARLDMFEEIHPLLLEFGNPLMSRDDWRRMLFEYPWRCDEEHRGYVLAEGGRIVGFLGALFSTRRIGDRAERFCNLSCWVVEPEHRIGSVRLLRAALGMREYTFVNLTPIEAARKCFQQHGFLVLEEELLLLAPVASPRGLATCLQGEVVMEPEHIAARLSGPARAYFDDHRSTRATQLLLRRGGEECLVIATVGFQRRVRTAHVHYLSHPELFWNHLPLAQWGLFKALRAPVVVVDRRLAEGHRLPRFACLPRRLNPPRLYRPAHPGITPRHVDALYSELMGLKFDPRLIRPPRNPERR